MKGLSPDAEQVFNSIKQFEIFKEFILIGGTALSLQIHHRLSEDLDFCKWQDDPKISNKEIPWPEIEKTLKLSGPGRNFLNIEYCKSGQAVRLSLILPTERSDRLQTVPNIV